MAARILAFLKSVYGDVEVQILTEKFSLFALSFTGSEMWNRPFETQC
jgi:hypothetical protein